MDTQAISAISKLNGVKFFIIFRVEIYSNEWLLSRMFLFVLPKLERKIFKVIGKYVDTVL